MTRTGPIVRRRGLLWVAALVAILAVWFVTAGPDEQGRLWRTYRPWVVVFNLAWTYAVVMSAYVLAGSGALRLRVMRVALMTGALAVVGALAEFPAVVLKFDYGHWVGASDDEVLTLLQRKINRGDPELIHVHWPHSAYRGQAVGNLVQIGIPDAQRYDFDVRYDRNGFRNDVDLEQADIVAIGDSFVEAALMPLERTVVKQLEQRLGLTVANLGQSAYGLQQELVVLKRYGLPLHPKVVLWFLFGGNDLRDIHGYEQVREMIERGLPLRRPFHERMLTINALIVLADYTTPARRVASPTAHERSAWYTRADGTRERVYFSQTNRQWKDYQWETATEVLSEAAEFSRQAGATFVLVYVPRKYRVYRDYLEVEAGTLIAEWTTNTLPEALGRWCGEQGMAYIDTTPYLQESVALGYHPYLVDDVHWNDRGHTIVTDAIVERLRAAALAGTAEDASGGEKPAE